MNAATHDHGHPRIPRHHNTSPFSFWLLAITIIVIVIALLSRASKDEERERAAARVNAVPTVQPGALLKIDIDKLCPRETPETTSIVVFTINTAADGGPSIEGCTRIAKRPYRVPGRLVTS